MCSGPVLALPLLIGRLAGRGRSATTSGSSNFVLTSCGTWSAAPETGESSFDGCL